MTEDAPMRLQLIRHFTGSKDVFMRSRHSGLKQGMQDAGWCMNFKRTTLLHNV